MRVFVVFLAGCSLCFAQDLADRYRAAAEKLIDAAMADRDGYAKLEYLCDRIGNRLSGSESLERAIEWARDTMQRDGLSNVRTIPVKVPHWCAEPNRRAWSSRKIARCTCWDWA